MFVDHLASYVKWRYTQLRPKPQDVKPSHAKVLTECGDLREAQVDVPLSVSHSCL